MHELSLARAVLKIVEEERADQGFDKVVRLHLALGAFSHVAPEALTTALESVVQGSPAQGAKLDIEIIPAQGACGTCGFKGVLLQRWDPCPECGGHDWQMLSGEELKVVSLDVR